MEQICRQFYQDLNTVFICEKVKGRFGIPIFFDFTKCDEYNSFFIYNHQYPNLVKIQNITYNLNETRYSKNLFYMILSNDKNIFIHLYN